MQVRFAVPFVMVTATLLGGCSEEKPLPVDPEEPLFVISAEVADAQAGQALEWRDLSPEQRPVELSSIFARAKTNPSQVAYSDPFSEDRWLEIKTALKAAWRDHFAKEPPSPILIRYEGTTFEVRFAGTGHRPE